MTLTPIIGNHVFIGGFDGETVDGSVVDKDNPPDNDPESNWRTMGCIVSADYQHAFGDETKNKCPSPGTYKDNGSTYGSTETTLDIGLKDLTIDSWQMIVGAASLDGSQVFTPGSEGQPKKGWLQIQMYESGTEDNLVNFKVWCQLVFGSPTKFSEAQTEATLNARILTNSLNSGQLLNSAAS